MVAKLSAVDPEAGELLADLPDQLVVHLGKVFQSPKPLAIALLAVVNKVEPADLSHRYKIPLRWALKYRDICLRALRREEVKLWSKPPSPKKSDAHPKHP